MTLAFELILQDSKKEETSYELYLPKQFKGYADSQTKEIINIIKKDIPDCSVALIPIDVFKRLLEKENKFSQIEESVRRQGSFIDSNYKREINENLDNLKIKIEMILLNILELYEEYYRFKKKF